MTLDELISQLLLVRQDIGGQSRVVITGAYGSDTDQVFAPRGDKETQECVIPTDLCSG